MTPDEMSAWLKQQQLSAKPKAAALMAVKARQGADAVQKAAARTGKPVRVATRVSKTESGAVLQVGYSRGFPGRRVMSALVEKGNGNG